MILIKNPNFLILDEPTNDLDTDTLNVLEDFLVNFSGVIILVSHDRYLIDKLTEQLFIFTQNGHLQIYNGNYTDFRLEDTANKIHAKSSIKNDKPDVNNNLKKNPGTKSDKELKDLEFNIALLEKSISDLNLILNDSKTSTEDLISTAANIQAQQKKLDVLLDKWLELSEV
ncbi:MAG: ABC transporter ATP-binding protein [Sphingobacteriaceae bacterium]|nr:MAG: ABC transporter ATP-binding protein [Sphingobacteriaceae bacterium]